MSVMKRVSMIFKAKANKALDRMEDPRETLDYSYQRQLEMLTQVRRGVAEIAGGVLLATAFSGPDARKAMAGHILAQATLTALGLWSLKPHSRPFD